MKIQHYLLAIPLLVAALWSCSGNGNDSSAKNDPPVAASPEAQLKASITRFPDSLLLRESLVQYYRETDRMDEALNATQQVLVKDSLNDHWWDMKAILHAENDDTALAIRAWERAVDIAPLPKYLLALGYLYADTKNEKALFIADGLLAADKAHSEREALVIKGIYYRNTGNLKEGIKCLDQALAIDYTYTIAYREKAILLYNNNQFAEAITLLKKGTTLRNNFDEGYYWMGRCYEKLKQLPEAIECYQQALYYDKNFLEAQDALARLGVK